jgi:hypothetical protein
VLSLISMSLINHTFLSEQRKYFSCFNFLLFSNTSAFLFYSASLDTVPYCALSPLLQFFRQSGERFSCHTPRSDKNACICMWLRKWRVVHSSNPEGEDFSIRDCNKLYAADILYCIGKVPGSNFERNTDYSD